MAEGAAVNPRRFPVMTLAGARIQAISVLADAAPNGMPEMANGRGKIVTFGDLVAKKYGPWVTTNRKDGEAIIAT